MVETTESTAAGHPGPGEVVVERETGLRMVVGAVEEGPNGPRLACMRCWAEELLAERRSPAQVERVGGAAAPEAVLEAGRRVRLRSGSHPMTVSGPAAEAGMVWVGWKDRYQAWHRAKLRSATLEPA